jgi:hypothetical protein
MGTQDSGSGVLHTAIYGVTMTDCSLLDFIYYLILDIWAEIICMKAYISTSTEFSHDYFLI